MLPSLTRKLKHLLTFGITSGTQLKYLPQTNAEMCENEMHNLHHFTKKKKKTSPAWDICN